MPIEPPYSNRYLLRVQELPVTCGNSYMVASEFEHHPQNLQVEQRVYVKVKVKVGRSRSRSFFHHRPRWNQELSYDIRELTKEINFGSYTNLGRAHVNPRSYTYLGRSIPLYTNLG
jgi:hypothetical protein